MANAMAYTMAEAEEAGRMEAEGALQALSIEHYLVEEYGSDPYESLYIGTVMSLSPSGKYYTLWACGNVEESEAELDGAFWEAFEETLSAAGAWHQCGEGDPCDVHVCRNVEESAEEED